jgi:hypothetical protein
MQNCNDNETDDYSWLFSWERIICRPTLRTGVRNASDQIWIEKHLKI